MRRAVAAHLGKTCYIGRNLETEYVDAKSENKLSSGLQTRLHRGMEYLLSSKAQPLGGLYSPWSGLVGVEILEELVHRPERLLIPVARGPRPAVGKTQRHGRGGHRDPGAPWLEPSPPR